MCIRDRGIDAPGGGDVDGLALLPGPGDVQARVLAGREVEPDLRLSLHHHPVGADVEIAAVGIAGDHRIAGTGITAAIERPVPRDRQQVQVNIFSSDGVLVDRGLVSSYLMRRQTPLELVLYSSDQFDGRRVRRLLERCLLYTSDAADDLT